MEFSNPVLSGMYPDPTICRVGRDFYLATSSCEYFPGVPIFHSRDLVNWRQLGHVLTRRSQLDLSGVRSSAGLYAPTLRYHDGTFFLVTTHAGRGHFVVTARNPRGPWSEPCWLPGDGIDPSLAFLDDRIYFTHIGKGSDFDHPFTYQTELAPEGEGFAPTRKARVIWKGTGGIWPEGPHLYRRGAWYYLLTAEGGTSYGHSVVVARAKQPYGPFEPSPHGPLVTHRDTPRHPIQATGHADFVDLDDGSTWAVLLAIRPSGGRHHHIGRETFLAPVHWGDDGWPRMPAGVELQMEGPPLPRSGPQTPAAREPFRPGKLPMHWVFVRNPTPRSWSLRERPGFLRLWGAAAGLSDVASPALVCRRQRQLETTARTRLSFDPRYPNEQAGLCIRASDRFHVTLLVCAGERGGRELRLARTIDGRTRMLGRLRLGRGDAMLEVRATARDYSFLGGTGRRLEELGRVPTRLLSAETILERTGRHHFTGTMIGLLATGNGRRATVPADFHWFEQSG
jgi:xylan 1,4-beta-xylosidase